MRKYWSSSFFAFGLVHKLAKKNETNIPQYESNIVIDVLKLINFCNHSQQTRAAKLSILKVSQNFPPDMKEKCFYP